MERDARILVLGAGAFGCATALALAEAGFSRVEVLEQDRVGAHASGRAAGILSLLTWNDEDAALIHESLRAVEDLVEWGRGEGLPEAEGAWRRVGGVTIGRAHHAGIFEGMAARVRRLGLRADVLEGIEAGKRYPMLAVEDGESVLWGEDDSCVEPAAFLALLRARAESLGVRFTEGSRVRRLDREGAQISGVTLADGSRHPADAFVVSGGAWTVKLLESCGACIAAGAYRTQLARFLPSPPLDVPVVHDAVNGIYARPEAGGVVRAGNGTELRRFDPDAYSREASPGFAESVAARLGARIPATKGARVLEAWAGLCVGTPDRRPLVGRVPELENLFVVTGDNGFGLMRSPGMGRLAAAVVADRAHPARAVADPARFGPEPPRDFPLQEGFALPP